MRQVYLFSESELNKHEPDNIGLGAVSRSFLSADETEDDYDLEDCPNCGSEAVGYDGTGSVPFLECFQCDHNWIP